MKKVNDKTKFITITWVTIAIIVATVIVLIITLVGNTHVPDDLGVQAVNLLYNFDKVEDLAVQDEEFKKITTDECYKELTATNADRALNTYLKFKKMKTEVVIIRQQQGKDGGYVLYTLNTNALSAGRKFMFVYDIKDGKIDNVREMETIDFVKGIATPSGVDDD